MRVAFFVLVFFYMYKIFFINKFELKNIIFNINIKILIILFDGPCRAGSCFTGYTGLRTGLLGHVKWVLLGPAHRA